MMPVHTEPDGLPHDHIADESGHAPPGTSPALAPRIQPQARVGPSVLARRAGVDEICSRLRRSRSHPHRPEARRPFLGPPPSVASSRPFRHASSASSAHSAASGIRSSVAGPRDLHSGCCTGITIYTWGIPRRRSPDHKWGRPPTHGHWLAVPLGSSGRGTFEFRRALASAGNERNPYTRVGNLPTAFGWKRLTASTRRAG